MGRPTKIEGNPEHPASLGATDVVRPGVGPGLYDPDRSQVVRQRRRDPHLGRALRARSRTALEAQAAKGGAGLRILTETVTSPTLAAQLAAVLAQFPQAQLAPVRAAGARQRSSPGARLAFGERRRDTLYRFDRADVVLSLDADFLTVGPRPPVRYARDFVGRPARRRRTRSDDEPALRRREHAHRPPAAWPTTACRCGRGADRRRRARARGGRSASRAGVRRRRRGRTRRRWIAAVAADLQAHRGAASSSPATSSRPRCTRWRTRSTQTLGNVGADGRSTPTRSRPGPDDQLDSLQALVGDMHAGQVELLLILGGNPVYDAPADLDFADALEKVPLRVHLGLYDDETARLCHWHVPEAHYLESLGRRARLRRHGDASSSR